MKEQQEEPRMLSLIDGWIGPRCLGMWDSSKQGNICGHCPARIICQNHRGAKFISVWIVIPEYEGIIEEVGVFSDLEKARNWLFEITKDSPEIWNPDHLELNLDALRHSDWEGTSISECEVDTPNL